MNDNDYDSVPIKIKAILKKVKHTLTGYLLPTELLDYISTSFSQLIDSIPNKELKSPGNTPNIDPFWQNWLPFKEDAIAHCSHSVLEIAEDFIQEKFNDIDSIINDSLISHRLDLASSEYDEMFQKFKNQISLLSEIVMEQFNDIYPPAIQIKNLMMQRQKIQHAKRVVGFKFSMVLANDTTYDKVATDFDHILRKINELNEHEEAMKNIKEDLNLAESRLFALFPPYTVDILPENVNTQSEIYDLWVEKSEIDKNLSEIKPIDSSSNFTDDIFDSSTMNIRKAKSPDVRRRISIGNEYKNNEKNIPSYDTEISRTPTSMNKHGANVSRTPSILRSVIDDDIKALDIFKSPNKSNKRKLNSKNTVPDDEDFLETSYNAALTPDDKNSANSRGHNGRDAVPVGDNIRDNIQEKEVFDLSQLGKFEEEFNKQNVVKDSTSLYNRRLSDDNNRLRTNGFSDVNNNKRHWGTVSEITGNFDDKYGDYRFPMLNTNRFNEDQPVRSSINRFDEYQIKKSETSKFSNDRHITSSNNKFDENQPIITKYNKYNADNQLGELNDVFDDVEERSMMNRNNKYDEDVPIRLKNKYDDLHYIKPKKSNYYNDYDDDIYLNNLRARENNRVRKNQIEDEFISEIKSNISNKINNNDDSGSLNTRKTILNQRVQKKNVTYKTLNVESDSDVDDRPDNPNDDINKLLDQYKIDFGKKAKVFSRNDVKNPSIRSSVNLRTNDVEKRDKINSHKDMTEGNSLRKVEMNFDSVPGRNIDINKDKDLLLSQKTSDEQENKPKKRTRRLSLEKIELQEKYGILNDELSDEFSQHSEMNEVEHIISKGIDKTNTVKHKQKSKITSSKQIVNENTKKYDNDIQMKELGDNISPQQTNNVQSEEQLQIQNITKKNIEKNCEQNLDELLPQIEVYPPPNPNKRSRKPIIVLNEDMDASDKQNSLIQKVDIKEVSSNVNVIPKLHSLNLRIDNSNNEGESNVPKTQDLPFVAKIITSPDKFNQDSKYIISHGTEKRTKSVDYNGNNKYKPKLSSFIQNVDESDDESNTSRKDPQETIKLKRVVLSKKTVDDVMCDNEENSKQLKNHTLSGKCGECLTDDSNSAIKHILGKSCVKEKRQVVGESLSEVLPPHPIIEFPPSSLKTSKHEKTNDHVEKEIESQVIRLISSSESGSHDQVSYQKYTGNTKVKYNNAVNDINDLDHGEKIPEKGNLKNVHISNKGTKSGLTIDKNATRTSEKKRLGKIPVPMSSSLYRSKTPDTRKFENKKNENADKAADVRRPPIIKQVRQSLNRTTTKQRLAEKDLEKQYKQLSEDYERLKIQMEASLEETKEAHNKVEELEKEKHENQELISSLRVVIEDLKSKQLEQNKPIIDNEKLRLIGKKMIYLEKEREILHQELRKLHFENARQRVILDKKNEENAFLKNTCRISDEIISLLSISSSNVDFVKEIEKLKQENIFLNDLRLRTVTMKPVKFIKSQDSLHASNKLLQSENEKLKSDNRAMVKEIEDLKKENVELKLSLPKEASESQRIVFLREALYVSLLSEQDLKYQIHRMAIKLLDRENLPESESTLESAYEESVKSVYDLTKRNITLEKEISAIKETNSKINEQNKLMRHSISSICKHHGYNEPEIEDQIVWLQDHFIT